LKKQLKPTVVMVGEDQAPGGILVIRFDENTSHSGIMKQVIDGLVEAKWAKRREMEQEMATCLKNGLYRRTIG